MAEPQALVDGPPGVYAAPSNVSVGVASGVVLAANPRRIACVFVNDHATQVVYLAVGATAVINAGIRINAAGGTCQFGGMGGLPLTRAAINGIATGATTGVTVQEITI